CRVRLDVDESLLGRTGQCPSCGMFYVLERPKESAGLQPQADEQALSARPKVIARPKVVANAGLWTSGQFLLGDFWVERPLGQGGMGAVYLVRSRSSGQRFAVKTIREDRLGD